MKTKSFLIISLIFSNLSFSQSWDEGGVLKYHEGRTPIRLGGGVNKNRPLQLKKNCLANQGAYDPDTSATGGVGVSGAMDSGFEINNGAQGAPETRFELKFIEDTEELHDILSISGIVGANVKFLKKKIPGFKLEGSYTNEKSVSKNSLNLVLKVKSNYGRQMLSDPEFLLAEKYQAMLDAGEYEKFEKYCGSHFVYMQRREGTVSAIFKIENVTEEEKRIIRAAVEVGTPPTGSWDDTWEPTDQDNKDKRGRKEKPDDEGELFSKHKIKRSSSSKSSSSGSRTSNDPTPSGAKIGARISLDNFLKSAKKIGKKASLVFHATGGSGISSLNRLTSEFDGSSDSLSGVLNGIAHYLEQYTFHSAPPVEYHIYPYFDFEPFEKEIDHALLKTVYYKFMDAEATMIAINQKLKTSAPDSEEHNYLKNKFDDFSEVRDLLWDLGQMILKNEVKENGQELDIMDVPDLPTINYKQFEPSILSSFMILNCYTNSSLPVDCGTAPRYFPLPTPPWKANLEVSLQVTQVEKFEGATLYLKFFNEEPKKITMIGTGKSNETRYGNSSFDKADGTVNFSLGKMTQRNLRDLYVKIVNDSPKALIKLHLKDGSTIDHYIEGMESFGNNFPHSKSSKISYSDVHFPSF